MPRADKKPEIATRGAVTNDCSIEVASDQSGYVLLFREPAALHVRPLWVPVSTNLDEYSGRISQFIAGQWVYIGPAFANITSIEIGPGGMIPVISDHPGQPMTSATWLAMRMSSFPLSTQTAMDEQWSGFF